MSEILCRGLLEQTRRLIICGSIAFVLRPREVCGPISAASFLSPSLHPFLLLSLLCPLASPRQSVFFFSFCIFSLSLQLAALQKCSPQYYAHLPASQPANCPFWSFLRLLLSRLICLIPFSPPLSRICHTFSLPRISTPFRLPKLGFLQFLSPLHFHPLSVTGVFRAVRFDPDNDLIGPIFPLSSYQCSFFLLLFLFIRSSHFRPSVFVSENGREHFNLAVESVSVFFSLHILPLVLPFPLHFTASESRPLSLRPFNFI